MDAIVFETSDETKVCSFSGSCHETFTSTDNCSGVCLVISPYNYRWMDT